MPHRTTTTHFETDTGRPYRHALSVGPRKSETARYLPMWKVTATLATMESQSDPAADAAAALDLVAASRKHIADRLITPWWYHPALGSVFGAYPILQAVDSRGARFALLLPWAIAGAAVVDAYRRHTGLARSTSGMWVNGFPSGRAKREAAALVAVLVGLFLGSAFLDRSLGWTAAPLVVGMLTVLCVTVLGRRLDRGLRDDLRAGVRAGSGTGEGRRS